MKLTVEQVVELKNFMVRVQNFEWAVKFREEEKRMTKTLPKKKTSPINHWIQNAPSGTLVDIKDLKSFIIE